MGKLPILFSASSKKKSLSGVESPRQNKPQNYVGRRPCYITGILLPMVSKTVTQP